MIRYHFHHSYGHLSCFLLLRSSLTSYEHHQHHYHAKHFNRCAQRHPKRALFTNHFGSPDGMHDSSNKGEHLLWSLFEERCLSGSLDALNGMDTALSINTYLAALEASAKFKALAQTQQIYVHLIAHHVPVTGVLGEYMVVALAKCGCIDDAKNLFSKISPRTPLSWNAIISALVESRRAEDALQMYHLMMQDGVETEKHTCVKLLKACGMIKDLCTGRNLHEDAQKGGFSMDPAVGSTLISMYGKCGAVDEAENVFREMSVHCIVSWNAMLSAYLDQNQGDKAIRLYRQMLEECVSVDQHTCVFAFRACCILADNEDSVAAEGMLIKSMSLEIGRAVHGDTQEKGIPLNVFSSTTLLTMYGKCGDLTLAETIFNSMTQRNSVSWNAMLSRYVEHRQGEKALRLYRHMHQEGFRPAELTYVMALQACGIVAEKEELHVWEGSLTKLMALQICQAFHADVRASGFASSVCVGTALLSVYGKCSAVSNSEEVFCALPDRDTVAWNAMLTMLIEQGKGVKALRLYRQMHEEGMSQEQVSLVLAVQACGSLGDDEEHAVIPVICPVELISFEIGRALHSRAHKMCFMSDSVVCNTLVSMYGKCGAIAEAELVCGAMTKHNVVTWNAMISTYVECGRAEGALLSYMQLHEEGLTPDVLTFVLSLQACYALAERSHSAAGKEGLAKSMSLEIGQALHFDARVKDLVSHPFVGTALLSMYAKCGAISEAESMFSALHERDVVSWNALLSAYVEQGQGKKALQLYMQMQQEGPKPYQLTYVMALQACGCLAKDKDDGIRAMEFNKSICLELGEALHADACNGGYASDMVVGNALMSMYGKSGSIMKVEDVFSAITTRNTVSWNVLLSTCVEQGQGDKGFRLYKQSQEQKVALDDVTLTCILQACTLTGTLEMCRGLHFSIVCAGHDSVYSIAVTLIYAYGSCASMTDANAVFDGLVEPNIVAWNACVSGFAADSSETSLEMFESSRAAGLEPDQVTFTSVISACTHIGFVPEGLDYLESLSRDDGKKLELQNYGSTVDLLSRAGDFTRVQSMLNVMPLPANVPIWLCLLGACRIHGNLDLGRAAFKKAVGMEPENPTAYVMMSNICADAGL